MSRSKNICRAVQTAFAAFTLIFVRAPALHAAPITWNLTEAFSGATPDGTLTVKLETKPANTVQLTVDATALFGTEFISKLYLNLNPGLDPTLLQFTEVGPPYYTPPPPPSPYSTGVDSYKADGDGFFDIRIDFVNSPPKKRLGAGKQAVFSITGIDGLTQESFLFGSEPGGGAGSGFLVAAHVQSIDHGTGSGWVTAGNQPIPEASTILLFGSGLTGLLAVARRKIRFLRPE